MPIRLTTEILAAAIEGFEVQKERIETQIAEIRQMLDGGRTQATAPTGTEKPRKKRSAAVRRKMALAQKARWAKIKKSSEQPQAVTEKPKRKMSAAGRKRIAEAARKRWAAVKAAKQG